MNSTTMAQATIAMILTVRIIFTLQFMQSIPVEDEVEDAAILAVSPSPLAALAVHHHQLKQSINQLELNPDIASMAESNIALPSIMRYHLDGEADM